MPDHDNCKVRIRHFLLTASSFINATISALTEPGRRIFAYCLLFLVSRVGHPGAATYNLGTASKV